MSFSSVITCFLLNVLDYLFLGGLVLVLVVF